MFQAKLTNSASLPSAQSNTKSYVSHRVGSFQIGPPFHSITTGTTLVRKTIFGHLGDCNTSQKLSLLQALLILIAVGAIVVKNANLCVSLPYLRTASGSKLS